MPAAPYLVADRHLRRVGKDALVVFEASLYSVPARRVRPGQRVELRVTADLIAIHALTADAPADDTGESSLLACHPRAARRGAWIIDETHWDGLPTGISAPPSSSPLPERMSVRGAQAREPNPLAALLAGHPAAGTAVATRPRAAYERVTGLEGKRV
ncbi:MAG: family transposase, partial [Modestobacter sp.]|nr:family transposase [Modestobacter sp.]